MSVRLRAMKGPLRGHTFEIKSGKTCVVGRDPGATISTVDSELARQHCKIDWDGTTVLLVHLGVGETLVNGEKVEEALLRNGDRLQAGRSEFVVEIKSAAPAARETGGCDEAPRAASPSASPSVPEREHGHEHPHVSLPNVSLPSLPTTPETPARPAPTTPPGQLVPIFESVEPTLPRELKSAPEAGSPLASLLEKLSPPSSGLRLYAIVDGAQDFELAFTARLMGHGLFTLFSGEMAEILANVGPCVIPIERGAGATPAFLEKWVEAAGRNVGALFETSADIETLGPHLRHLFVVTDEEGQEYFFRFYDPRVFRAFLPTCTEAELQDFFGPVRRWLIENEDGSRYDVHAHEAQRSASA